MKNVLILSCILILFNSCRNDKSKSIERIEVKPFSEEKINLSDFVKSVTYLPLETSDSILVGEVDNVVFANGNYYLIDKFSKNSILAFDDKGKFLFEIFEIGKGPGEYVDIMDAVILESANEIQIADMEQRKIIFYNLKGEFLKEIRIPASVYFVSFFPQKDFYATIAWFTRMEEAPDLTQRITADYAFKHFKLYNVINYDKEFTKSIAAFKPYNIYIESISLADYFDNYDNQLFVTYAYSDTIFKIEKSNLIPAYHIDFGINRMPEKKDEHSNGKLYNDKNAKYAGIPDHLSITSKYVAFTYATAFNPFNSVIYFKSNKKTINFNQVNNDINGGPLGFIIGEQSEKEIISLIQADNFIEYCNNLKMVNNDLQAILNVVNENSNPILMKIELK